MKTGLMLLSSIVIFNLLYSQEYNNSFLKILELTNSGTLPFETRKINDYKINQISENLVISGILNNDSTMLTYILKYYDNDEQKNIQVRTSYKFWSISKMQISDMTIFVYMKVGNDSLSVLLSTYNKTKLIDNLCIGLEVGETEIIKYKESKITDNLEINSKYYEWNPKYLDKNLKDKTGIPKTIVTLTDYKIDKETGKIILIKQERRYSECIPEEFTYPNSHCQIFDKL